MASLADRWLRTGRPRICVVGDVILDRYLWSSAERISPEAPVLVVRADRQDDRPGGAASVAALLRSLECEVSLVSVVGNDAEGECLRHLLRERGISASTLILDAGRPTTFKSRILSNIDQRQPHQLLRIDRELRHSLSDGLTSELLQIFDAALPQVDCVLVSDYGKGICTEQVLRHIISHTRQRSIPLIADPAKGTDFQRYRGMPILTPNRTEAAYASGRPVTSIHSGVEVANQLCRDFELDAVVLKLDSDGLVVCQRGEEPIVERTAPKLVCDVTGAGDTVLAALGLCLASGWPLVDAARIANIAAGVQVERIGVESVTRREIAQRLTGIRSPRTVSKIIGLEEATRICEDCRATGRTIVYTNGCYDLLHAGHVACLEEAAELGDLLLVAVNSDRSVRRLKGADRPIVNECQRTALIAALSCVDYVLLMDDPTPHQHLQALLPHVLVKGSPYSQAGVVGSDIVRAYGGRVHLTEAVPGLSTTDLVARVRATSSHKDQ